MAWIVFVILSVLCVGAVAAMIVSRNQAHNALFLVLAFSSLGGIFGLLDAPFAAAVQVLVYAGAIMVLFLFAIMMFNLRQTAPPEKKRIRLVLTAGLGAALLVELVVAGKRAILGGGGALASPGRDIVGLGKLFFSDYLYAFEITSVLILAALVGALALAGKKEGS
jgi:NADH-quinone oxidoreductase subunit J